VVPSPPSPHVTIVYPSFLFCRASYDGLRQTPADACRRKGSTQIDLEEGKEED